MLKGVPSPICWIHEWRGRPGRRRQPGPKRELVLADATCESPVTSENDHAGSQIPESTDPYASPPPPPKSRRCCLPYPGCDFRRTACVELATDEWRG